MGHDQPWTRTDKQGDSSGVPGLATDVYVRAVAEFWEEQGFHPGTEVRYEDSSVRRTTFESYAAGVDWTDLSQVERALRVFETQLRWLSRQGWLAPGSLEEVRELLDHDGFRLDEHCRIHWRRPPALEATLANLTDPSGIRAELERIRRALPNDPAGAIGAAKQLVEATAKVVLTERGLPVDDRGKVPDLVKAAQQALCLHPSSATAGPDGSDAVKKILGGCRRSLSAWQSCVTWATERATGKRAHPPPLDRDTPTWP